MGLFADLRFGLRLLRRSPGFTAIAVLVLALGIGANTAMFTVVNTLLVRSLPFERPDQLAVVLDSRPSRNQHRNVIGPADYLEWKARAKSFQQLAAWNFGRFTLTGFGTADELKTHIVSHEFFDVLRVQPLLGRAFLPAEDRPGGPRTALISYNFWQRRLGGNPGVLGQKITVDNQPINIVGVMPADFVFMDREISLWLPMQLDPANNYRERSGRFMFSVARIRDDVTPEAAQREMSALAASLEQEHPSFHKGWSVDVVPLREYMVGDSRLTLLLLMGAVAMVLLIACANVASLVLAKATSRAREIAVRMSVGGSRWRVVRQLLAESLLLAVLGGLAGAALSFWGTELLLAMAPKSLPMRDSIRPDWTVFVFALGISLLTGVLFGLFPALQAMRSDPIRALHGAGRTHGQGRSRLRSSLVVVEVALSVVLLAGAGLLIRSLDSLNRRDVGIDPRGVATMRVLLPRETYNTPEKQTQFIARALDRVREVPGVESATSSTFLPGTPVISGTGYLIEGRPEPAPGERPSTQVTAVDPDFFRVMRVRLVSGRYFEPRDNQLQSPRTFVVNEEFAKAAFPGESPLGRRIRVRMGESDSGEIVGVVANVRHTGLAERMKPAVYYPNAKLSIPMYHFLVRAASGDPGSVTSAATRAIQSLDPTIAVGDVRPLEAALAESIARMRFTTVLLAIFSGFALLLAALGLYGLLSWLVVQRTSEIGLRMALGARPGDVLRLMMGQGLRLVGAGLLAGVAASTLLVRFVQSMLFDVRPQDPLAWSLVPLVLVVFSVAALTAPAVRASRLQPVVALRSE